MVQRVYRQIRTVDTDATVTIATSKSQVSAIHNQLGENVGISVEPCRRDTFPAIALAAAYLKDVQHIGEEEAVVICPVDPYVEDDYFKTIEALGNRAAESEANLVLMGIEPTYPSEKYGYIIPKSKENISEVSMFKEKPTAEVAEGYISQGALWNGGVFAFRLGYVLKRAHELIDFKNYDDLFAKYNTLKKISFDYVLLSGNETGMLLLDYICSRRTQMKTMPEDPVTVKTIVTIDMAERIAAKYGVKTINVLTGFKFIGEQIGFLEKQGKEDSYIFGMEESYGYLSGSYVRDDEDILKAIAGAADALYDIYRENQVPGRRCKLLKDMERIFDETHNADVANALAILEANEHTIYDPPAVFDSNKSEILLSTENKLKEIYEVFPNEGKVVLGYSYLVSWNYVTWLDFPRPIDEELIPLFKKWIRKFPENKLELMEYYSFILFEKWLYMDSLDNISEANKIYYEIKAIADELSKDYADNQVTQMLSMGIVRKL